MKILAVSDVMVNRLYTSNVKENFPSVELVLGCGDLPFEYLEFLVSSLNVPLLYVAGNHDPQFDSSNPAARADGCQNIDRQVAQVKGLTIAGLGGSALYKPTAVNQYTQSQMWGRAASLAPALLWSRLRSGRVPDIMIAHSPPLGIHDDDDQPHVGFAAFVGLIKTFQPRYFLHGHTLAYRNNLEETISSVGGTQVININPYRVIDVESYV
ncbi:MAG: metallophosphoesterase family protein [Chloroflexi bacterium]|nr:metallophosphoesterase family protein [Chloroflexota bacterium]